MAIIEATGLASKPKTAEQIGLIPPGQEERFLLSRPEDKPYATYADIMHEKLGVGVLGVLLVAGKLVELTHRTEDATDIYTMMRLRTRRTGREVIGVADSFLRHGSQTFFESHNLYRAAGDSLDEGQSVPRPLDAHSKHVTTLIMAELVRPTMQL